MWPARDWLGEIPSTDHPCPDGRASDQESFFVRHAYFTGGDDPYERLRRALRAEIDEASWQSPYSSVSRPLPPPSTGKIAVKVINHFGDEVLKVYDVR